MGQVLTLWVIFLLFSQFLTPYLTQVLLGLFIPVIPSGISSLEPQAGLQLWAFGSLRFSCARLTLPAWPWHPSASPSCSVELRSGRGGGKGSLWTQIHLENHLLSCPWGKSPSFYSLLHYLLPLRSCFPGSKTRDEVKGDCWRLEYFDPN